jgi:hypothetical protein
MAFPTTPLQVAVSIAPGADPADTSGWTFTDITNDVRVASGVTITSGRQDEGSQVGPTSVAATLDNSSGDYCRTNPLGAYYGSLARGTPMQVAITRINDAFGRTTSPGWGTDTVSGLAWTHSSSSVFSTNGSAGQCALATANTAAFGYLPLAVAADVEVTCSGALSAATTGAAWVHAVVLRMTDTSNHYRLHTEFATGGTISCKISKVVAGSITDLTSITSTGASYSAGTTVNTRARMVGSTLQIRAWLASGSEPTTWTCEVDDTTFAEAGMTGLYEWRVAGNTNAGTLTSTIDNFRVDVLRAITPVPEWPARWDQSAADVTAPITGAGVLRRLGQGQSALRSPLYRQLPRYSPAGFWPLEDGTSATTAASGISGGRAAAVSDVTLGADGPPGASSAISLNSASSYITGSCSSADTADGYAGMVLIKLSALPGSENTVFMWNASGTVTTWRLTVNATVWHMYGTDAFGTTLADTGDIAYGTVTATSWWAMQIETLKSGANVNWSAIITQIGSGTFGAVTGSYVGVCPRLVGFRATGYAGTSYSSVWLGDNDLPYVDPTFSAVAAGYSGELAGDRMVRLAAEEGLPLTVIGDTADTSAMGVQTSATLVDLFRECEDADQGVLHERGAGLGYLTRWSLYNQSAVVALDFASGHIAQPPEPTDDDQRLRNKITLTRTGGSAITVQDAASIALNGTYSDEVTANLGYDGQLSDHAGWRLHLGTISELRWPRITLNLARNPSLIDDWCRVRIGSRITIANPPSQVGVDDLDLIVEGWTETLGPFQWDVALVCSPASAYNVGVYATTYRYDLRSSVLNAAKAAGVTSVTFRQSEDESWSTTSTPYDVLISGEQVTVTSMGARSGTGPWLQAATVTRAVNGVSKALPVNAEVHVATPGRYAI